MGKRLKKYFAEKKYQVVIKHTGENPRNWNLYVATAYTT